MNIDLKAQEKIEEQAEEIKYLTTTLDLMEEALYESESINRVLKADNMALRQLRKVEYVA